ncbi:phosphatidylethanolamine:Kdo2-lipid A phosphoethanolamine transferase [Marinomonas alcarazii]|uniref:Phosphatidylethanolamine:Kdo2-lipid A phosphoethanolamine transferase n=1 Tax=Marinomonas alcarazii TaxID=491949 RepID=A0A318UTI0_9GAMM|nr:phosphoethanolamine--lipid A transferase [Marinomonas alcarazii]PYF79203.1 phosphatidylethanolamine:Kdo2-lipid A phosphoethanolamine transferase [Marinomonas alcarazii]
MPLIRAVLAKGNMLGKFGVVRFFKRPISYSFLSTLVGVYLGTVLNLPIINELIKVTKDTESFSYTLLISVPIILSSFFVVIFQIFSFPFVNKIFFIPLIITSASCSYATLHYGVIWDIGMIENTIETDPAEALGFLSLGSMGFVFFLGILPSIFILFKKNKFRKKWSKEVLERLATIFIAISIGLIVAKVSYKEISAVGRNYSYMNKLITPTHVYGTYKYLRQHVFSKPIEYRELGNDAKILTNNSNKPNLIFVVIGETARSQNIQYNGYSRNTNPYTEKYDLVSFSSVESCGTATAHSLPCMFSNLSRQSYKKAIANSQSNVLDIIQKSGYQLLWKENDGGDKGVAKRIPFVELARNRSEFCDGSYCYDEALITDIDKNIQNMEASNKLLAFHIIGSHGTTYYKRYPKSMSVFEPACERQDIEQCTDQEIVNVYDNTIVYTDFILSQLIEKLKKYQEKYNVGLIYVSDHGESLGENGLYLHGAPYAFAPEYQTQVPWFVWLPEETATAFNIDLSCLKASKDTDISHDYFFHSLLSLTRVSTQELNPKLNIFNACLGAQK